MLFGWYSGQKTEMYNAHYCTNPHRHINFRAFNPYSLTKKKFTNSEYNPEMLI